MLHGGAACPVCFFESLDAVGRCLLSVVAHLLFLDRLPARGLGPLPDDSFVYLRIFVFAFRVRPLLPRFSSAALVALSASLLTFPLQSSLVFVCVSLSLFQNLLFFLFFLACFLAINSFFPSHSRREPHAM